MGQDQTQSAGKSSATALDEERVREVLRGVIDPEIGVNIVDLGLVYDVVIEGGEVRVAMTVTQPGCPLHEYLRDTAETALRDGLPGAQSVQVAVVWDPPWNPDMMSEAAREKLGWGSGGT